MSGGQTWGKASMQGDGGTAWSKGAGKTSSKADGRGAQSAGMNDKGKGSRLCHWGDCRAACRRQATWGGKPDCFGCMRPWSNTPPVEKMVEWAFLEKVAERHAADQDKGNDKGKGAPKNDKQTSPPPQRRRSRRRSCRS